MPAERLRETVAEPPPEDQVSDVTTDKVEGQVKDDATTAEKPESVDEILNRLDRTEESASEDKSAPDTEGAEKPEEETKGDEPEFDDDLIELAAELGVDEERLRKFGTPEAAENALYLLADQRDKRTVPTPVEQPKDDVPEVKEQVAAALKLELGDDYDEKQLVVAINKSLAAVEARLAEGSTQTTAQLAAGAQQIAQLQETLFMTRLDANLRDEAAPYMELFGGKSILSLSKRSKEWKAVAKVIESMQDTVDARMLRGRPIPSDSDLLKNALVSVHGDRFAGAWKDKNGKAAADSRKKQFLSSTSSRAPRRSSEDDKTQAKTELAEKLRGLRSK